MNFRLLTAPSANPSSLQSVNNEYQLQNQQLSPQEKTFLSLLLTNSTYAKDLMARKSAHDIANDQTSFKSGFSGDITGIQITAAERESQFSHLTRSGIPAILPDPAHL